MTQDNNSKFIPPHPLNTAVLFLVFNRLDTTKQVFEAIRKAKPPRLYVAADGARELKEGKEQKVKAVREYIMQNINWECEVKTLFREKNLGCKYAVSGAIDWFFENEEMGIILEDDCLPSQSFFWFCEELLELYQDDQRIMQITGTNFLPQESKSIKSSYFFSDFGSIWGWATWRRAWEYYDVKMNNWHKVTDSLVYKSLFNFKYTNKVKHKQWVRAAENKIDTWDYQWMFAKKINSGLNIVPVKNLISNIGFGSGTHTLDKFNALSRMGTSEIGFPLKHPNNVIRNLYLDKLYEKRYFKPKSILQKIFSKIYRIARSI